MCGRLTLSHRKPERTQVVTGVLPPPTTPAPYTLKRSRRRRRTVQLSIHPVAGLLVAAPAKTPQPEIDAFVKSKARWIRKALQDAGDRERHLRREFVTGDSLPYLGRLLHLRVVDLDPAANPSVEFHGASLDVAVPARVTVPQRRLAAMAVLQRWYRAQAEAVFAERVGLFAPIVGVRAAKIIIKAQKTLWGSCSKDGVLHLNWALVAAPLPVLDLLVVHELCHLRYRGHGVRFWNLVGSVLPDYQSRRAELRRTGWRYRFL